MTRTRLLALGLLVPAALGFSATRAWADGETISLVQNDPSAVVGRATNFTASGSLDPGDTMFGFDIFIFLKDADADPTCGATFDDESAAAAHSGGNEAWISPVGGFQVGMGPSFNQPFKITFTGSGNYLLCGYVQGDFSTFAGGELRGVVAPAPGSTQTPVTPAPTPVAPAPVPVNPAPAPVISAAAVPAAVHAPRITRKGHVLTCHPGTWSNAPASLSYRWYVKRRPVGSRSRLTVRHALRGRMVACRVTAANAAGHSTAWSRAVRAR